MGETVLDVQNLTKRFGGFVALDSVSLHLDKGERLGLIGPNGSGKTTMINCISGALFNDEGSVLFDGRDITKLPAYRRAHLGTPICTAVWYGPVIGALILGAIQEAATVTISSELNLLIVGVMLVLFITLAPNGIVGLVQDYLAKRRADG